MPETVEGYVLVNTCVLYPLSEVERRKALAHALEHLTFRAFTAQGESLVTERKRRLGLGLLRGDAEAPAAVGSHRCYPTEGLLCR